MYSYGHYFRPIPGWICLSVCRKNIYRPGLIMDICLQTNGQLISFPGSRLTEDFFFKTYFNPYRFEWAWQHPKRSRRLSHLPPKKSREKMFEFNVRLLAEMLNVGPWSRLPLTIRWLKPDIKFAEFPEGRMPPGHMPIIRGPVKSVKFKKSLKDHLESEVDESLICSMCIEMCPPIDQVNIFF